MEQQTKKPTHKKIHSCKPLKPTQNQSLQKSCFLADASPKFDTFVILKLYRTNKNEFN